MKKDLKGKERAVPPGIEIPGIPARKLVKCGSWLFTRDIPDFPDCVVEGRNLLEALDGTRKRLSVRLAEMMAQNLPLPQESLLDEIS